MKLTNFTFLRAGNTWLLKSLLPMLVFMTLSLGVEAQASSLQEAAVTVDYVDDYVASQRLKTHINELEAQNPITQEEQANRGIRLLFANFIMQGMNGGEGYGYRLENYGQGYLEEVTSEATLASGFSFDVPELYREMKDLLRS